MNIRAHYDPSNDLGPVQFAFNEKVVQRKDLQVTTHYAAYCATLSSLPSDRFQIKNLRNQTLQCTHWIPTSVDSYAVVVYCHGNCGSRVDAEQLLEYLLPNNISLFAFDFSGACGSSNCSPSQPLFLRHLCPNETRIVI